MSLDHFLPFQRPRAARARSEQSTRRLGPHVSKAKMSRSNKSLFSLTRVCRENVSEAMKTDALPPHFYPCQRVVLRKNEINFPVGSTHAYTHTLDMQPSRLQTDLNLSSVTLVLPLHQQTLSIKEWWEDHTQYCCASIQLFAFANLHYVRKSVGVEPGTSICIGHSIKKSIYGAVHVIVCAESIATSEVFLRDRFSLS